MILKDSELDVSEENLTTLIKAAGGSIEPFFPALFAKMCSGKDLDDFLKFGGGGGGPAVGGGGGGAGGGEEGGEEGRGGGRGGGHGLRPVRLSGTAPAPPAPPPPPPRPRRRPCPAADLGTSRS